MGDKLLKTTTVTALAAGVVLAAIGVLDIFNPAFELPVRAYLAALAFVLAAHLAYVFNRTELMTRQVVSLEKAASGARVEVFESRDEWYNRRRGTLDRRWKEVLSRKSAECDGTGSDSQCRTELATMEKKRDDELRKLERQRLGTATSPTLRPATPPSSVESRLKSAKDLFDRGVISREEYEQKRREIMSSI